MSASHPVKPRPGQFTKQINKNTKKKTIEQILEPYHFSEPYDPNNQFSTDHQFKHDYKTGYGLCQYEYCLLIIDNKYFYVVAKEKLTNELKRTLDPYCQCNYCVPRWKYWYKYLGSRPKKCFNKWSVTGDPSQDNINKTKQYVTRARIYFCYEE